MNSILLLLIVIAVVVVIILAFGKSSHKRMHMNRNTAKWIFGTYCAVLLTSVLVLYLIPDEGFLYPENDLSKQSVQQSNIAEERVDIFKAAEENRLDQTKGIMGIEKKKFAFQGNELEIALHEGDFNIQIIVKRKEQIDGQFEAAFFTTKTLCNNIELSDRIKSPKMELIGDQLRVINPDNEIKLTEFRKDFTITQFLDVGSRQPDNSMHLEWGQKVLYLQIPQNVQIKATPLDVKFVGE